MSRRLALVGASGHGKVVADIAKTNGYKSIVFFDDRWCDMKELYGIPVVGDVSQAINEPEIFDTVYVSIGNTATRADIQPCLQKVGPALIHPSAVVSQSAVLGPGTVVMPNAVINANAKIGKGVIVNSGALIEHDCVIGDFTHICPNSAIAGGVSIGEQSWIGIGSSIIQLLTLGDRVIVGAGAVVIKNVPCYQTVGGVPAKPLHR